MVDGTPAALAGLRPGDLVVAVDNHPVTGMAELQRLMVAERIGVPTTFTVARDSRLLDVALTPVELRS